MLRVPPAPAPQLVAFAAVNLRFWKFSCFAAEIGKNPIVPFLLEFGKTFLEIEIVIHSGLLIWLVGQNTKHSILQSH